MTPKLFKDELGAGNGPITVWINSPGGDVFAAAQIYNMLMDYPYDVTVKIDGLAASAASVIAMAGTTVEMSPVAMMMIHNPATIAIGDSEEMKKAVKMLDEVKESIMNAYEIKTGLARDKISKLMDAESWFNAKKAVELGFADKILFSDGQGDVTAEMPLQQIKPDDEFVVAYNTDTEGRQSWYKSRFSGDNDPLYEIESGAEFVFKPALSYTLEDYGITFGLYGDLYYNAYSYYENIQYDENHIRYDRHLVR